MTILKLSSSLTHSSCRGGGGNGGGRAGEESGEVKMGVKHTCYDLDLFLCILNLLIFSCC